MGGWWHHFSKSILVLIDETSCLYIMDGHAGFVSISVISGSLANLFCSQLELWLHS